MIRGITGLAIHKPREHALRIYRYKQSAAACQHFPFFIQNLGHVDVLPSLHADLARFHPQRPMQRHGPQIFHRHLRRERHHMAVFIHLAHRLVEDGRNDSAVAVSGRSGVALAQPEAADETVALLVIGEPQLHAVGIVSAASEAVVLLQFYVACIVPRFGARCLCLWLLDRLLGTHRKILSRASDELSISEAERSSDVRYEVNL
jgi:hypothetical protein